MKATLLALSLVACGQTDTSDGAPPDWSDATAHRTAVQAALTAPDLAISGLTPADIPLNAQRALETPELQCAVGSWMGDDGPETYRVDIFAEDDGRRARVRHALTHDPAVIIKEGHHPSVEVVEEDDGLLIEWPGVGIHLWQANEGERIWGGFLYGLEDHTFVGEGPPPPCGGAQITCWEPQTEIAFHYDPGYGTCVNDQGEEGLANRDMIFVRETKNGECADLRWGSATDGMGAKVKLTDLNLRGADLSSFFLESAHIVDARLEGAMLTDIALQDGSISGTIDWMTDLPEEGCDQDNSEAFCTL